MLKTKEEVEEWLIQHNVSGYHIRDDLTVDVANSVYLSYEEDAIEQYSNLTGVNAQEIYISNSPEAIRIGDFGDGHPMIYDFKKIESLPIQFGVVQGEFWITDNNLRTLKGCPSHVEGRFICYNNNLSSLEGAPKIVKGKFNCSYNQLTSLEGAPRIVEGNFDCDRNKLSSLVGSPKSTFGRFACYGNDITSLEGAPEKIGSTFYGPPLPELTSSARIDSNGDYRVSAEDFNTKVQELKRIRDEKALLEASVAKLCDTPQIGNSPESKPVEPTLQQPITPKRKFKI